MLILLGEGVSVLFSVFVAGCLSPGGRTGSIARAGRIQQGFSF